MPRFPASGSRLPVPESKVRRGTTEAATDIDVTGATQMSKQGKIVQIIGAVVDVEFPRESVPRVYDALKVQDTEITLEVQQQLGDRSEEHTSELQSLMRISYAVFCLKKKNINNSHQTI